MPDARSRRERGLGRLRVLTSAATVASTAAVAWLAGMIGAAAPGHARLQTVATGETSGSEIPAPAPEAAPTSTAPAPTGPTSTAPTSTAPTSGGAPATTQPPTPPAAAPTTTTTRPPVVTSGGTAPPP